MSKLKLVYESKRDGERHLYGSETGIPADTDVQLTYDPAYEGQQYVYTKSAKDGVRKIAIGESLRQIPAEEDKETEVKCGAIDVINNVEVNETKTESESVKEEEKKEEEVKDEVVTED